MKGVSHIIGPPGCGKTHTLAVKTRRAVLDAGRRVGIVSLTNAAAHEIKARTKLSDPEGVWVGTLHKACMETLGVTADELTVAHVDEWNEKARHHWQVSEGEGKRGEPLEGRPASTWADDVLERIDLGRHRMLEPRRWALPTGGDDFRESWEAWKRQHGLWDFTDLIEGCAEASQVPLRATIASGVDTLVVDECQDSTRLELDLVRRVWAERVERVVLAGDADQCLYAWRAADPRVFLDHPAPVQVLGQSYRVPRAVHAVARGLIRRIDDRLDAEWAARDAEGEVIRPRWTLRDPDAIAEAAVDYAEQGSVMVLSATQYQVRHVVNALRDAGVGFSNPWAPDRGEWNPLSARVARGRQVRALSTVERFLRYVEPDKGEPTMGDVHAWLPLLAVTGCLARGVQGKLEEHGVVADDERLVPSSVWVGLFAGEEQAMAAWAGDPAWLVSHASKAKRRHLELIARIYARGGRAALVEPPRIHVGTIHSVKGATADTVIVLPDVTHAMWRLQARREEREAQVRAFYVSVTRAKERLVLPEAAGKLRFAW